MKTSIFKRSAPFNFSLFLFSLPEEAALRLGQDREFMTRLVEWCAVEEHPGVKGQSKYITILTYSKHDISILSLLNH